MLTAYLIGVLASLCVTILAVYLDPDSEGLAKKYPVKSAIAILAFSLLSWLAFCSLIGAIKE